MNTYSLCAKIGRYRNAVLMLLLMASASTLSGCGLFSYLVANLALLPKEAALYHLPKDKNILVFPDDVSGQLSYPPLKKLLAQNVAAAMMREKLAASVVPYQKVDELSSQVGQRWYRMDDSGMGVAEVTRTVGADLAVYLSIRHFQLKDNPSDPSWRGKITVLVKVVDRDGKRLWPTDRTDGYEVSVDTSPGVEEGATVGQVLTQQLAGMMAEKVTSLFYKHTVHDNSDPLNN